MELNGLVSERWIHKSSCKLITIGVLLQLNQIRVWNGGHRLGEREGERLLLSPSPNRCCNQRR